MPVQITEWSDALMTSLASAMILFFSAIPKIIGFLVIVLIGWFVASVLERAITAVLRRIRFNDFAARAGLTDFVAKMGMATDAAGLIGLVVKWFVRLVALAVAFDALGLPAVSEVLQQLLLWLPNVVVALVVLVIGGLAAKGFGNVVRGMAAEADLSNAQFLAKLASVVVWAFAIVVAIHQIGVATELVNALFIAIVGSIALGLALAFGLGGREMAAEMLRKWYDKAQEKQAQLQQARDAAVTEDTIVQHAGSWPTGGYPGTGAGAGAGAGAGPGGVPAHRRHAAEGG
ncbi:MAG TPA: small-conductance mechanosensitive ion channel [Ramlibacter sp.]|uniref:mechanosensitive ion channel family protein n=1 Tax=Ramlibacter sp. TaxID=1917967 RepID=UPI002C371005|nr:small-conductance mechanosensitive ion channel [Ramlibacter sp.]HVZ46873.1 small-conductance mechanosensitive ion channel [Ramlibacter sp.]